jgi:hypothetical protein
MPVICRSVSALHNTTQRVTEWREIMSNAILKRLWLTAFAVSILFLLETFLPIQVF